MPFTVVSAWREVSPTVKIDVKSKLTHGGHELCAKTVFVPLVDTPIQVTKLFFDLPIDRVQSFRTNRKICIVSEARNSRLFFCFVQTERNGPILFVALLSNGEIIARSILFRRLWNNLDGSLDRVDCLRYSFGDCE